MAVRENFGEDTVRNDKYTDRMNLEKSKMSNALMENMDYHLDDASNSLMGT